MPGLVLRGRYRLDVHIATGGMGEVWRGTDLAIDRPVAIKVVRPEQAGDEEGLARFRAEAHYAGSLSHPNIAQVFDYGEAVAPEPGYLVMELVDGLSLTRMLDEGPLPPEDTMDVVAQAARGLAAAHRAGLVHRDIKPGNLLVRSDGLVKITDFGIAHADGETQVTQPGMLIGTPAYLAPERMTGAPASPATDLYSLGVVAHQCLTGHVPFAGEPLVVALAHLDQGIPALPPSVPPGVAALVMELTRQDPAARPPSAWDVALRAEHLRVLLSSPQTLSWHGMAGGSLAVPGAEGALGGRGAGGGRASCRRPAAIRLVPASAAQQPAPVAGAPPGAAQDQPGGPRGPGRDRAGGGRVHRLDAVHAARAGPGRPAGRGFPGGHAECRAERPAPAEPGRGHAHRRRRRPGERGAGGRHPAAVPVRAPPICVADALIHAGLAQRHAHPAGLPDPHADDRPAQAHAHDEPPSTPTPTTSLPTSPAPTTPGGTLSPSTLPAPSLDATVGPVQPAGRAGRPLTRRWGVRRRAPGIYRAGAAGSSAAGPSHAPVTRASSSAASSSSGAPTCRTRSSRSRSSRSAAGPPASAASAATRSSSG